MHENENKRTNYLIGEFRLLFHGLFLLHLDKEEFGTTGFYIIFLVSEPFFEIHGHATLPPCTSPHVYQMPEQTAPTKQSWFSGQHKSPRPQKRAKRHRHCRRVSSSKPETLHLWIVAFLPPPSLARHLLSLFCVPGNFRRIQRRSEWDWFVETELKPESLYLSENSFLWDNRVWQGIGKQVYMVIFDLLRCATVIHSPPRVNSGLAGVF